ncbi:VTC domain-containing protein [Mycotypha africana]|uniref:VTC domain-containing protein n=1 Tax=Mycotypha africana TaxID=64632 RepID=UPI002300835A|nr:VTC domain-containing protein [Mycotypha africana]KAI8987820.1 VTC domain-containing protein [Mycotypha africana]
MKFGAHLESKIYEPWRQSYIQYNQIKLEMKRRQLQDHAWSQKDESEFKQKIASELAKVYNFVEKSLVDLNKRVENTQASLSSLTALPATQSKGYRKKYDALADVLTEILFDVNDLAKFHHLNCAGFRKMIKKHDKHTKLDLKSVYSTQMTYQWPLEKLAMRFDVLIIKISELHDVCHLYGNPRSKQEAYALGGDQTAFERATAKYWIHPDNITEVKSIILFHLPVHVYNKKKQYEESDMAISSVYFDNDQFDLYGERLSRSEGAEAIRLRWYGPLTEENDNIYVERKTHKAAWLDGKSVKDRFRLKEQQVNAFLSGVYSADQFAIDLRAKISKDGKKKYSEDTIEENHFIASGVQTSIKERRLNPMCRVFYNRTAFQLPGDQRLRISLDSNLTFIREDGPERRERIANTLNCYHWKRNDIDINYPFQNIPEKDISRFPYAVLETKLQTHLGQQCPAWLASLIDSHLVHEVPRFSKYLHGASILFPNDVPFFPYWLEQFETLDIRKPAVANIGLTRSMSFKPLVNGHHRQSLMKLYEQEMQNMDQIARDAANNEVRKKRSFHDLRGITSNLFNRYNHRNKQHQQNESRIPHLSINLIDNGDNDKRHPRSPEEEGDYEKLSRKPIVGRIWYSGAPFVTRFSSFKKPKKEDNDPVQQQQQSRFSRRGPQKKIEPKTHFANERTFISWLQFCALLLTVALNLLNNGDRISRIIGAVFIILSSLLSIYALVRFQMRSYYLRVNRGGNVRYDDIWGPTVLCISIVTALCVNFYLRADILFASHYENQVPTIDTTATANTTPNSN